MAKRGGESWRWTFKDAAIHPTPCPTFTVQGVRGWLSRPQLTSARLNDGAPHVLVFLPELGRVGSEFAKNLAAGVKSAVSLGRFAKHVHVLVTCASLEQFDRAVRTMAPAQYYADVGGAVADKFGMRPVREVVDVAAVFADGPQRREYAPTTLTGVFLVWGGTIVKSPAFQPRLQGANVTAIKGLFDLFVRVGANKAALTDPDSFGADIPLSRIRLTDKAAWEVFEREWAQQQADLGEGPAPQAQPQAQPQVQPRAAVPQPQVVQPPAQVVPAPARRVRPARPAYRAVAKVPASKRRPDVRRVRVRSRL